MNVIYKCTHIVPFLKQFYTEAVEKKEQNWQLLQNLRSERILDGIDPSLSANLSQSLISVNSFGNGRPWSTALSSSIESFLSVGNRDSIEHNPLSRTKSADPESHKRSTPSLIRRVAGSADCAVSSLVLSSSSPKSPRNLERASSLGRLLEKRGESSMVTISESKLLSTSFNKPHRSTSDSSRSDLQDVEELSEGESIPKIGPVVQFDEAGPLQELDVSQGSTVSIISDDSGTESGESPIGDSFPVRNKPPIVTSSDGILGNRRDMFAPRERSESLTLIDRSSLHKNGPGLFHSQREKLVCDFDVKNSSSENLPCKMCFQATQSHSDSDSQSPSHISQDSSLLKSCLRSPSTSHNTTTLNSIAHSQDGHVHIDNHLMKSESMVETTPPESVSFVSPKHTIIPVLSRDRKASNESENQLQTDSSPSPNLEIVECKIFKTNKLERYSSHEDKKHHRSLSESALHLPTTLNESSFSITLVPSTNQQSLRLKGSSSLLEEDNETMEEESRLKRAESNSLSAEGDKEDRRLSATSSNSISSSSDTLLFQCDSRESVEEGCTTKVAASNTKVAQNPEFASRPARSDDFPHSLPHRDRSKSSLSKYSSTVPQYRNETFPKQSSKSVPASPSRNGHALSPNASPRHGHNITPVHKRITQKSVRELLQMFESNENISASSECVGSSPTHQPPGPMSLSPLRQRAKMDAVAKNVKSDPIVGNGILHPSLVKPQQQENEAEEHSLDDASTKSVHNGADWSNLNPSSKAPAADFIEKMSTCSDPNEGVTSADISTSTGTELIQRNTAENDTQSYSTPVPTLQHTTPLQAVTDHEKSSLNTTSIANKASRITGPPSVSPKPVRRTSMSPKSSSTFNKTTPEASTFISDKVYKVAVPSSHIVPRKPNNKAHTKNIQVTSRALSNAQVHTSKSNPLYTKQTAPNAKTPNGHLSGSRSVTPRGLKSLELSDSMSRPCKASTSSTAIAAHSTSCKSVKTSPTPKRNSVINTNKISSPSSSPSTCRRVAQGSKSPKSVPKLLVQHSEDKKSTKLETKKTDSQRDLSPFSRESSRPIRKRKVTPSHLRKFQVSSSCPSSPATRPSPQRQGPSHQSLNNSPISSHNSTSLLTESKESHKPSLKQAGFLHSPKGKPQVSSAVNARSVLHKTSLHLRLNSNTNNNNNNSSEAITCRRSFARQHDIVESYDRSTKHDLSPLILTQSVEYGEGYTTIQQNHSLHESEQKDENHDGPSPPYPLRRSSTISTCPKPHEYQHKLNNTHTITARLKNKVFRTRSVDSEGSMSSTSATPDHSLHHQDIERVPSAPSAPKRSSTVSSGTSSLRYRQLVSGLSLRYKNKRSPHEWQNFGLSWRQHSKASNESDRPQLQRMNSDSSGAGGRRGAINPL